MRGLPGVAAVLWDMDGTLVDTEPYWIESEFEIVEEHGGTWTHEHAMNLVGNDLLDSGRYIHEHARIDLEPSEIVELLLDRVMTRMGRTMPWRPGAVELLTDLRERGVRCALVTMSYRRFVAPILGALPEGTFEVVVTGDTVSQGKPHPEAYLHAAASLGVDPASTLAIEDSNTGARAAESAGCTVLVVEHHVPVLASERRVLVQSLAGMTADDLPTLLPPTPR
ncbi:MAG TPA: HAD family phosphatase [Nocardioidaceae bacterium]|nr:HAD family phosphatase [Nocardioidaceae bacterium]